MLTPIHTTTRRVTAALFLCALALTVFSLAGCRESQPSSPPHTTLFSLHKSFHGTAATVTQRTSSDQLSMADELTTILDISFPEGSRVTISQDEFAPNSLAISSSEQQPPTLDTTTGMLQESSVFHLVPFLPGAYSLPAYTITVSMPDGVSSETIRTEPIPITVTSVLLPTDDQKEIADILPPLPADDLFRRALVWGLIAAGIALAAVLFWLLLHRRKNRAIAPPAPLPPHRVASAALDRLLADHHAGRVDTNQFFLELSAILRHYIEAGFAIRASEQTTEEFLATVGRGNTLLAPHKALLHDFLSLCDLVKFARHLPLPAEPETAAGLCRTFIEATTPAAAEQTDPPQGRNR